MEESVKRSSDENESPCKHSKLRESIEMNVEEASKSLSIETTSLNDYLPPEVLRIILGYLDGRSRKNARLVCSSWYKGCNKNVNVIIRDIKESQHLENSGFERINLRVVSVSLPISVWEKIGTRIHSLELSRCQLGDQTVENIIRRCNHLRVLRMSVNPESFCSPETLENLDVVQKKLETLQIVNNQFCAEFNQNTFRRWERIFSSFLRIFPCVSTFVSIVRLTPTITKLRCSFSKAPETSESGLASSLTFFMSSNEGDWRKALASLSALRLTSIKLYLELQRTLEDKTTLLNFFDDHKELQFVEVMIKRSPEMLKSLLFKILDQCYDLRRFRYEQEKSWSTWAHNLTTDELSKIYSKSSRMEELSINGFIIRGSSLLPTPGSESYMFDCRLIQYYLNIEHLIMTRPLSDEILQSIFQYLTRLKTLDLCVGSVHPHEQTTNFGITGRRDDDPAHFPSGYSIKRLQNLERMKFEKWSALCQMDDTIFLEFDFPKLRYLYCSLPDELSILSSVLTKIPLVKEIDFSQSTIKREFSSSFINRLNELFEVSPNLKVIHTNIGTHHCDPVTGEVTFRGNKKFSFYQYW